VLTPDHYKRRVSTLRQRFADQERGDYVFKQTHSNGIPADGLELYMTMVWVCIIFLQPTLSKILRVCRQEKIRLNENLNLPDQHELLARLMCDRISASLLEEFRPKFASHLAILNEGQVVDGLGSLMRDWGLDILGKADFTCQACFTHSSNNYVQDAMIKLQGPMFNLST